MKRGPANGSGPALSPGDEVAQLSAALAMDDFALFAAVLGDVARERSMAAVARDIGMTREGLYKALAADGNPSFATVVKVLSALGLKLSIAARAA